LDNCLDIEIELVGRQGYGFSGATLSNLKTDYILHTVSTDTKKAAPRGSLFVFCLKQSSHQGRIK